jgi:hypothetical protein
VAGQRAGESPQGQLRRVTCSLQGRPPNRPLQQTKPRSILRAFIHHVRGLAAERQDVRRTTEYNEP